MEYTPQPQHFGPGYFQTGEKIGQIEGNYDCGSGVLPTEIFKTPATKTNSSVVHKTVARALFQSQSPTRCDSYNKSYD